METIKWMFEDYVDMWCGDLLSKAIALLTTVVVGVLLILIGWLSFIAADSWFVSEIEAGGEVSGKNHHPAWTQMQTISTGKTIIVVPIHHPESWTVNVLTIYGSGSESVSEKTFDWVQKGQPCKVKLKKRRLSKGVYITEIDWRG